MNFWEGLTGFHLLPSLSVENYSKNALSCISVIDRHNKIKQKLLFQCGTDTFKIDRFHTKNI